MSDLKQQTISGIIWSAVERFGTMSISFISNIVLARLLSPDDFGCIGMLAIFIALSNTFLEGGFGSALIQKKTPTQADFSTVFYWNVLLSLFLYVTLFLLSPAIAVYFHEPKLTPILRVQALILIPNSLSVVHANMLRKSLQFRKLARIILLPTLLGAVVGIILAYRGLGVWSLVAFQLLNASCLTMLYWRNNEWRPSFEIDLKSFTALFSYGGFILISNLLNTLMENIQGLLIGRKFSASIMGYYAQARKLEDIPATSLSSITSQVTFPVFSKIQDNKEAIFVAHRKITIALNTVIFPIMLMLIVLAEPLIITIFSEKWSNSISLFRILCLGGMANCLVSVNYNLYISSGNSKKAFKWNTYKQIIGIINILIGLNWGVKGMLYGMVVNSWLYFLINASLSKQVSGYGIFSQIKDCIPMLLVALIASLITWAFCCNILDDMLLRLICGIQLFVSTYLLMSILLRLESTILLKSIIHPYLKSLTNKLTT